MCDNSSRLLPENLPDHASFFLWFLNYFDQRTISITIKQWNQELSMQFIPISCPVVPVGAQGAGSGAGLWITCQGRNSLWVWQLCWRLSSGGGEPCYMHRKTHTVSLCSWATLQFDVLICTNTLLTSSSTQHAFQIYYLYQTMCNIRNIQTSSCYDWFITSVEAISSSCVCFCSSHLSLCPSRHDYEIIKPIVPCKRDLQAITMVIHTNTVHV